MLLMSHSKKRSCLTNNEMMMFIDDEIRSVEDGPQASPDTYK